jgi:DNA-binding HxlR family transcriptional regulator
MRGKKTDLSGADCAIARSLGVIGDWWSLLIIRDALAGKQRFSDFEKSLSLAKNILSSRLKKLVEQDIFTTVTDADSPTRRLYMLTPKGEKLYLVLIALWQWGEDACFAKGERRFALVDNQNKAPLAPLQAKASDGHVVGPRTFHLAKRRAKSHGVIQAQ